MVDIAFIHAKPHRAHRIFAESIDADFYPFLGSTTDSPRSQIKRFVTYLRAGISLPTGYDYYILEGGQPLLPGAILSLRERQGKIILLNADETFINMIDGLNYYGTGEKWVHRACLTAIDGIISVGEFVNDYVARTGVDCPTEVVYPSIEADLFDNLDKVEPDLESKRIVSVGFGKPSVGFDILVEAFSKVRGTFPNAELHIAGEGHPKEWDKRAGITVHGWVDDLPEFLASGSVSSHPGRAECFPVSTLEPMRAGVPCQVSTMVGTKSVVSQLNENLVAKPTIDATAEALKWYFGLSVNERSEIATHSRTLAKEFSEAETARGFKRAFENLREEI